MIANGCALTSALAVLACAASVTCAQQKAPIPGDYPNKPIRIVTTEAGGSPDFATRLIAQGITGPLGQPMIVDNRPAIIAIETVMRAPPDGYTMLHIATTLWIQPLLQKVTWDPIRDFSPITISSSAPNMLVVHPSLPVKSVKELIALAKAEPGKLNYTAGATGGVNHLAAELFKAMAGVDIVGIHYKSGSAQMSDLVGGQVQLTFGALSSVAPHIKSGKLRAVAVTSAQPSALAPGLPTVAATVPGYEVVGATAVLVPVGTPAAIISRLNREIVRFINLADVKEQFSNGGFDVVGSSPEELAAKIKSEMTTMGKVIKDAGIHLE